MRWIRLSAQLLTGLALGWHFAWATQMDLSTHDLVIEKLENVLKSYRGEKQEIWAISSRLADLYADRARLRFMAEQEKGCENCHQSKEDRGRALRVYQDIFNQASLEAQERILLQIAHLHQLNGNTRQARRVFENILASGSQYSQSLRGQAETGLGEMAFRQGNFQVARRHFEAALRNSHTPNRPIVQYRLAWSMLNLGEETQATQSLMDLLRHPDSNMPQSFYEDASRDLATFFARGPITQGQINTLLELSHPEAQRSNLFYLATEADRLGQKAAAMRAFEFYGARYELTNLERMDLQIRKAQLEFDLGRQDRALEQYSQAANSWRRINCRRQQDSCAEIQSRFKNFVVTWHRVSKTRPTASLSAAYQTYIATFPEDADMIFRSAQLAQFLKQHEVAVERFRSASSLAHRQLRRNSSAELRTIFEGALVGEIESAEQSKNSQLQFAAYDHYLNLNPQGEHAHKVRYQRAQLNYAEKNYRLAADQYREVALNSASGKYQVLAADLALDSLALLKEDRLIQDWADELSKALPQKSAEYQLISFRALINESKQALDQSQPARQLRQIHQRMKQRGPVQGSTGKDNQAFHKNRLLLAMELKDQADILVAGQELINIRGTSQSDRNLALAAMAETHEAQENFNQAYNLARQIQVSSRDLYEQEMRLAHLAGRAGRSPRAHFQKASDSTNNIRKKNEALAQLILIDRNPWALLKTHRSQLRRSPLTYSRLVLEVYGLFPNRKEAEEHLKNRALRTSEAGLALQRALFHADWRADFRQLISHNLERGSDQQVQSSIQRRLRLLNYLEGKTQTSLSGSDWTEQIVLVNLLSYEYDRFFRELVSLPSPRGLNAQERTQYQQLLGEQAAPFREKSEQTKATLNQLWNQSGPLNQLAKDYETAQPGIRNLIAAELRLLERLAPERQQNRIRQILQSQSLAQNSGSLRRGGSK